MRSRHVPRFWNEARNYISQRDPILKNVIEKYPASQTLKLRSTHFETLLKSIVGQQISVKAADSIWKKFSNACWVDGESPDPKGISALEDTDFRKCGISPQKIKYIRDLSLHFCENKLKISEWDELPDEQVIQDLCQVKGIGEWTAQMFLIFHLQRPDVLPLADLGLQKAVSLLYKKRYPMSESTLLKVARPWAPYRSVATWYLWRSLDPIPVEY